MEVQDLDEKESPRTPNQLVRCESQEKICRICFEPESPDCPMIVPCECSGSMKYIHEDCLKKWILSKTRDPKTFCCDVCKSPLAMEVNVRVILSCKELKEEIFKIIVFPVIIIIVTTIIALIVLYLCVSGDDPKVTTSAKIYLSLVMFSCFSIDVAMIIIFYKALKIGCCQIEVKSWNIFSVNQAERLNATTVTEVVEKKEGCVVSTQVMPMEDNVSNPFIIVNNSNDFLSSRLRNRFESRITDTEQMTPRLPCEVSEEKINHL